VCQTPPFVRLTALFPILIDTLGSTRQRRERLLNLGRVLYCILNFPKINLAARYVTAFLVAAILLNAALVIMGSMPEFQYHPAACLEPLCTPDQPGALCTQVVCAPVEKDEIVYMNVALVLVFTLEYLTRLCTAHTVSAAVLLARRVAIDLQGNLIDTVSGRGPLFKWEVVVESKSILLTQSISYRPLSPLPQQSAIIQWGPWRKTWEYASSFMGLVDLASALPFFIALFAIRLHFQPRHLQLPHAFAHALVSRRPHPQARAVQQAVGAVLAHAAGLLPGAALLLRHVLPDDAPGGGAGLFL